MLVTTMFSTLPKVNFNFSAKCNLSSANAFNLDQSKMFGEELSDEFAKKKIKKKHCGKRKCWLKLNTSCIRRHVALLSVLNSWSVLSLVHLCKSAKLPRSYLQAIKKMLITVTMANGPWIGIIVMIFGLKPIYVVWAVVVSSTAGICLLMFSYNYSMIPQMLY